MYRLLRDEVVAFLLLSLIFEISVFFFTDIDLAERSNNKWSALLLTKLCLVLNIFM